MWFLHAFHNFAAAIFNVRGWRYAAGYPYARLPHHNYPMLLLLIPTNYQKMVQKDTN